MGRVLVVDDEQGLRDVLEVLVSSKGHAVVTAKGVDEARTELAGGEFDLVITDLRLEPGGDGMDVVRAARSKNDPPECIVMTAYGTREKALLAHDLGALFYLEKGPHLAPDMSVLLAHAIEKRRLKFENEQLRSALADKNSLSGVVGKSEVMQEVFELVERIAPTRANVLVTGESGTGKERIARAIHLESQNRDGPFVAINCGAIPENLIESELFGHVRGSFTGADSDKQGLFVAAERGTIFLDEIGELPISLQPKLLRVIQERRVLPIGATQEVDLKARIIAATNRDLEAEVKAGRFREDLYFRLNVLQLDLPPLRERVVDIPLLAKTFLHKYNDEYARSLRTVSPEAMKALLAFPFPGNVRQLENVMERAVALSRGDILTEEHLPKNLRSYEQPVNKRVVSVSDPNDFPDDGVDLDALVDDFELKLIKQALDRAGGKKKKAAELLGLSFRQFRYKMSKHNRANKEPSDG